MKGVKNMVNSPKSSHVVIKRAAFTYMGTIVGAGFATGREITEFFTQYGIWGTVGIFVSSVFFIFLGMKIMLLAVSTESNNLHSFLTYLFGPKFGGYCNGLIVLMIIGVTIVMLSGAGALFQEQLHLSKWLGVALMVVLCYGFISRGIQGLHDVNGLIVPFMILFSFMIFIWSKPSLDSLLEIQSETSFLWLFKALIYASFNLTSALAVLIPLAHELKEESYIKKSSQHGGIGLMMLLLFNHFAISRLQSFQNIEIPTAELLVHATEWIHLFFVLVILGEIFSTLAANSFGIMELAYDKWSWSKNLTLIVLLVFCAIFSSFQYSVLISILYPLFGVFGLIVIIRLLMI